MDLFKDTLRGLDCIDFYYYITVDKSLDDVMQEIQRDYEYDQLPSEAMYIFEAPEFHNDVFRGLDEEAFEEYLRKRYFEEEEEPECILYGLWLKEAGDDDDEEEY